MTRRQRTTGDDGYVLVLLSLALASLMIFAAFSVDVGAWYARAAEIQKAADAAALAGVVWMPDFDKARTEAMAAAKRNGFDDTDADIEVTPAKVEGNSRQLRVMIKDNSAPQFFSQFVIDNQAIARSGTAEWVLPVPLGSPRNYFGTGTLNTSPVTPGGAENLSLSVNTWCTDKVDGDRHQSQYSGNRPYSSENCPSPVPSASAILNKEYKATGYEFYVEVPDVRSSAIDLLLNDAMYRPGSGSPDLSLYDDGDSAATQNYKFSTFMADDTPLDDSDNPVASGCTKTYARTTAFDYPGGSGTYLGSANWNRLCTIGVSAPAGRWIVRVTNTPSQRFDTGSNQYAFVAKYQNQSGSASLCDGRVTANCPRVFGKDAISVFASQSSATADFYLAEIDRVHAGKKLRITLFDPGEGGSNIRIRKPTGANTWTDATFSWTAINVQSGATSGTNVTSIDVTNQRFNGATITVDVSLAGYNPPANNEWWQIRYNFSSGSVTDRTTWSATIIGDPVHLVGD